MKCLLVTEGGAGPILPTVPLAQALRNAGHDVIAAAHAAATPLFLNAGVPAVAAPQKAPVDYRERRAGKLVPLPTNKDERVDLLCALGAQIAADTYHDLLGPAQEWRPDIVIGGPLAYAAAMLAHQLRVPLVSLEFGMAEPQNRHLATMKALHALGFAELAEPARTLVLCPESIRPQDAVSGDLMRHIAYAPARLVEPWMHTKPVLPRVLVSAGSRVSADNALDDLTGMVQAVAQLDVELLVAAPDDVAARLGPLPPNARAGWMPFDVLAKTCDLIVHHGGGSTMLGCAAGGTPQVIIPFIPELAEYYEPLRAYGAAQLITEGDDTSARVHSACKEMLSEPSYRDAAARLKAEIIAAPAPATIAGELEVVARTIAKA